MRRPSITETWTDVPGWPYQVSGLGHIKRRGRKKPVVTALDGEGYTLVTLERGKKTLAVYMDTLICSVFGKVALNPKHRPVHVDGLPWSNLATNLKWGLRLTYESMENLVTSWTVRHGGKLQHGPFTDIFAATAAAQWVGDVILGRNTKREIVTYEIMYSRNRNVSPRNPFDLVKKYRSMAEQHSTQFWSLELLEAAEVLEAVAIDNLHYNSQGEWPVTALRPTSQPRVAIPVGQVRPGRQPLPIRQPVPISAEPRAPLPPPRSSLGPRRRLVA